MMVVQMCVIVVQQQNYVVVVQKQKIRHRGKYPLELQGVNTPLQTDES